MLHTLFKTLFFSIIVALAGCSGALDSSKINWNTLYKVTDATSLQRAITMDDDSASLVAAGLFHYTKLLRERTIENQDRAKTLYNRIQMHAGNSVILANDFVALAELEMLHLGWSSSMTSPYTQGLGNRQRAFDASTAIFRTTTLMKPNTDPDNAFKHIDSTTLSDALIRLKILCLVARNPWSANPEQAVSPELVARVRTMASSIQQRVQNANVSFNAGRSYTEKKFADTKYPSDFANMCEGPSAVPETPKTSAPQ